MAQNYTEQLRKDNVRDAIYEDLQNNCEVLRTSWSGNAFPANPKVGQPCYRVDEDKLYYWDGYKWSQKGGGGSAELKTMELAAATSERVSITLEGARCLDKNMMFVFVDKIAQDPSTYSMNDDGTVINFSPSIPANAAVTLRWFDTDVGTFDTAIFATEAEFEAGTATNKAPTVKQVHSLSDQIQTSNVNYVKSELQSNLLNYTTNRILEIPQDIKLELNNGILKLKAGCRAYAPNGFEADGTTPKFDVIVNKSDEVNGTTGSGEKMFLSVYANGEQMLSAYTTGGTVTERPASPIRYALYYNTTTNKIEFYDGSTWISDCSFPISLYTRGSTGAVSIGQVFNGFGYIGKTIFLLPGVKFQTSQGKNIDGSIKTAVYTRKNVSMSSLTFHTGHYYLMANDSVGNPFFISKSQRFIQSYAPDTSNLAGINYWYNTSEERWYNLIEGKTWKYMPGVMDIFGEVSATDGLLYDFKGYPLNHINTYQRTELAGMGMPSGKYIDLTPGASGTTYVAPANGWFSAMNGNGKDGFCSLVNQAKKIGDTGSAAQGISDGMSFVPVIAGDTVVLKYSGKFNELNYGWFCFIYAQGEQ